MEPCLHSVVGPSAPDARGYLEANIAATAGQLSSPRAGRVVIDGREVLASTAQVVGAELGEVHFNTFIAQTMLYVNAGMPPNGAGAATLGELHATIHGPGATKGGRAYASIVRALNDLYEASITVSGYNSVTRQLEEGTYSKTRLLVDLAWHEALEEVRRGQLDDRALGALLGRARLGSKTVHWVFHHRYVEQIRAGELVSLDWERLRSLRGVAKTLWLQLAAPRFEFARFRERPDLEWIAIPLSPHAYDAFNVRATEPAARRRTLLQAGERIMKVDPRYVCFELASGRGERLQIVRRVDDAQATLQGHPPRREGQLQIAA
jgi:hypothetical protein